MTNFFYFLGHNFMTGNMGNIPFVPYQPINPNHTYIVTHCVTQSRRETSSSTGR